jgi:hypothetical protein
MATTQLETLPDEKLVVALADRLLHPPEPRYEPFVIEDRVAQTKSLHVVVIWDEWEGLDRAARGSVIMDAYARAKRSKATLTVAMGLTQHEALRMGFLRYKLITAVRKGDPISTKELAAAYATAGGVLEVVGKSTIRRYPTQEAAEDAYRAAFSAAPGPYWIIEREVDAPDA